MKSCFRCEYTFSGDYPCPSCHAKPHVIDEVVSYSPDLSASFEGYDPTFYQQLAELESSNFWFVSRNEILLWLLKKYAPEKTDYLEIGCGTGYVLQGVSQTFPKWRIDASELFAQGIAFAKKRVIDAHIMQMDATNIPYSDEYDVIGAYDVIEHIEDDIGVIGSVARALRKKGLFFITVPQHSFLWSQADDAAHHFRRYQMSDLKRKLEFEGFEVIFNTSFVSLLMPLMFMSRLRYKCSKSAKYELMDELKLSPLVNSVLLSTMRIELRMIKAGMRFPAGGSLVVVARKL